MKLSPSRSAHPHQLEQVRGGTGFASPGIATLSRTVPFALFMAFIGVEELARLQSARGWLPLAPTALYYLYPVKALTVAALLFRYRKQYRELSLRMLSTQAKSTAAVCLLGFITFLIWIRLDYFLALTGPSQGFNPGLLPAGPVRVVMTLFRVAGAVLVVPVMEELFWRSFLIRYLVAPDFRSVALGTFTWGSFLLTALLFGLEHQLFYAGVIAGAVYNLILYKTRSVVHCILAHAITNLSLAIYVLYTGKWYFW